ncbi:hypothetical protein QA641_20490 [Bradyrhizobium sp. CB1650]|uniref:hypothetical protein n=1 Tax=Bradyrhizobium sp. CB1650 TaxID=3039153 RepID=UPI002434FBA6|nr:hypothetical protein [Bradyrhizobium sp. CB1650]WGD56061.1 hypothetical protein QA641_20490 [Bradyrhizobium sp. CB1650]
MMFAHAAFERRVSELMDVITGDAGFGERRENQWNARKRPTPMGELIREHRPGGSPEAAAIVACLKRSILFCDDRNLLGHGTWWEFDTVANAITVRAGVAWPDQDQHRRFTVDVIQDVAARALDTSKGHREAASVEPSVSHLPMIMRRGGFIEPRLPSKVALPPSGLLWVHEIKPNGYRLMARRDGSRTR